MADQHKKSIKQRWDDLQPSKTMLVWSCAGSVVVALVVGFTWGGWVTGGTAREMAETAGEDARYGLASAICVEKFLAEGQRVRIGTEPGACILTDQKVYGLWGLYTVSARVSGLVEDGPIGLTARARDFVEACYSPTLRGRGRWATLEALVRRGGTLNTARNQTVFRALREVFREKLTRDEVSFYAEMLRDARQVEPDVGVPGRQELLARLLERHADLAEPFGREEVTALAEAARPDDEGLSRELARVRRLEALLAPAEALFQFVQTRTGQRLPSVASEVRERWGSGVPHLEEPFRDLAAEVEGASSRESVAALERCDAALAESEYEDAILALLDLNGVVMTARNAAPWVRIRDGKLDVRYRSIEHRFPDRDDLETLWRNSYFVDALKSVTAQLKKGEG